jgi:L-alanine-DL-glutamate epimerase-like enolase superfamily enzyme
MKITDVTLTLFAWDDIPPTQYGQHSRFAGSSALGLLRIATDDGVEGHAFLGSASNSATTDGQGLITHLKPVLMGRNPLHREALVVDLWKKQRAAGVRTIGAVDVALWDLLGKAVGQPIHRLLGTYREAVPAYASSAVLAAPAAYAEEAQKFKEHGWAAYKIHPPTRWKEDIKVCEAVRKAVGDYTIMLDSTWSYDYPTAVRVGRAAEEMGFHWYEDPLADQDIYNYVKLKQQLSIPILANVTARTSATFSVFLSNPLSAEIGKARGTCTILDATALPLLAVRLDGATVRLTFPTVGGRRYRLERTDGLASNVWTSVADNLIGTGAPFQLTDPVSPSRPTRFYRLRLLAP